MMSVMMSVMSVTILILLTIMIIIMIIIIVSLASSLNQIHTPPSRMPQKRRGKLSNKLSPPPPLTSCSLPQRCVLALPNAVCTLPRQRDYAKLLAWVAGAVGQAGPNRLRTSAPLLPSAARRF